MGWLRQRLASAFGFGIVAVVCTVRALALEAATAPAGLTLGRQVLLPLLAKDDWQRSAFSNDGRLLLVAATERSFVLHAESGRELRAVKLSAGEHLKWARARPNGKTWIGYTSSGSVVEIDPATGETRGIYDVKALIGPARDDQNSGGDISFEHVGDREIVALVNTPRERPQPGGGTYRWDQRTLIKLDLQTGALSSRRGIADKEFFVNSGGRIAVNPSSGLAVTFDPTFSGDFAVWRFPTRAREQFSFVCKMQRAPFDVRPYGSGFALFFADRVEMLESLTGVARDCQRRASTRRATTGAGTRTMKFCQGENGTAKMVAVKDDPAAGGFVAIFDDLEVFHVRLATADCLARTPWTSLSEQFQPWNFARQFGVAPDRDIKPDLFLIGPITTEKRQFMVSGGTLLSIAEGGGPPERVTDLIGISAGSSELDLSAGLLLGTSLLAPLRVFDLATLTVTRIPFDYAKRFHASLFYHKPYAIIPGLKAVATFDLDGVLRFYPVGAEPARYTLPAEKKYEIPNSDALCVTEDARRAFVTTNAGELHLLARANPQEELMPVARLKLDSTNNFLFKVSCNETGTVVIGGSLTDQVFVITATGDNLALLQTLTDEETSSRLQARPSLSQDGLLLAVGPSIYARSRTTEPFVRIRQMHGVERISFEAGGDRFLAFGPSTALYRVDRAGAVATLREIRRDLGPARDGAFLDKDFAVLARNTQDLDIIDIDQAKRLGTLLFGGDNEWLFTDPAGRFDTGDLERNDVAHWIAGDDPLRPLRPELYMRDYYEPRLMTRLLDCHRNERTRPGVCADEVKPVPPLADLNRAQPDVEVVSVVPEAENTNEVVVTVKVSGTQWRSATDGSRSWDSGVYDVRLFRDGRLVRQEPDVATPQPLAAGAFDLEDWRTRYRVVDRLGDKIIPFRHVTLPGGSAPIEFSAYAFNADRVKSVTRPPFKYDALRGPARDRKAYVIAVGVSAYQDSRLDLNYADDDARRLAESLAPALMATGRFQRVVSIPLLANWEIKEGQRVVTATDATKANVKSILDVLAGRAARSELQFALPEDAELRKATPDDLVVIAFSSHGYADKAGNFYLFPYDIGEGSGAREATDVLSRAISSAELTSWLRDIDAAEMIMVIDACHSAASVESSEFKPGPMGSRGLGQLAYDKGIRILASTRADDVAWESSLTQQGLLSYALVQNGLVEGKADFRPIDGRVGVEEWLQYAVSRVPQLYLEAMAPKAPSEPGQQARLTIFDSAKRSTRQFQSAKAKTYNQQPALFSYRRDPGTLLIKGK